MDNKFFLNYNYKSYFATKTQSLKARAASGSRHISSQKIAQLRNVDELTFQSRRTDLGKLIRPRSLGFIRSFSYAFTLYFDTP